MNVACVNQLQGSIGYPTYPRVLPQLFVPSRNLNSTYHTSEPPLSCALYFRCILAKRYLRPSHWDWRRPVCQPYQTSSPKLLLILFRSLRNSTWFGNRPSVTSPCYVRSPHFPNSPNCYLRRVGLSLHYVHNGSSPKSVCYNIAVIS